MLASISRIQSVLNFYVNAILIFLCRFQYLNVATLSKNLLPVFILWYRPSFYSRDTKMYLVFSAFSSRSASLLATNKACVVFFMLSCVSFRQIN